MKSVSLAHDNFRRLLFKEFQQSFSMARYVYSLKDLLVQIDNDENLFILGCLATLLNRIVLFTTDS